MTSKQVFICVTCGARLEGLDLQEQHSTETGHSNFELHPEYEPSPDASEPIEQAFASGNTLTSKVTLPKKAWLRVAEIQSYYNLKDMNKALLKAINIAYEGFAEKKGRSQER